MSKQKDYRLKSSDTISGVQDDQFFQIKDELQAIKSATGMYLAEDQTAGALHLEKEIFNNALDECNNNNSHWDTHKKDIFVEFYESQRKFVTTDNGRGIPLDMLTEAVMNRHTSTKIVGMSEARSKKVTGLNGVGLTVVAALSDYTSFTSFRGKMSKTIEVIDGELVEHDPIRLSKPAFGTSVTVIPSEKYLGPINLTTDIVENYFRQMSYVIPNDVTIYFTGEINSTAKKIETYTTKYKAQGLRAAVEYLSSSLEFDPIEVSVSTEQYDLSMAFSYDKTLDESAITSFCNFVITTEGGCHEVAATQAICAYFTREARRQEPNSKYEITFDDCRKGLILAVNLEHITPKFEGQHKTKVSNHEITSDGKKLIQEALFTVMNNNPAIMKKIIAYLRNIAKARHEACKIKGVSVKKKTTFLDDAAIQKYFTVSNRNSTGYKELFLCEGDSAAGAVLNCRNAAYQAVYTVRGVTNNVYSLSLTQLLQKQMFKDLITILGTGIGKDFDITKLRYNKIIICTDSDVDGYNITSLLFCFFFIFMPELIHAGKLYKAMAPLYLMDVKSLRRFYKGREWLYDKVEYYRMLNTIIADNCEIALEIAPPKKKNAKYDPAKVKLLSKKEALDWLFKNSEYLLELDNLGKKAACDTSILENICFLKRKYGGESADFQKALIEAYPEMTYDHRNHALLGSYNGEYQSLICDSLFDRSAQRFINEMAKNDSLYVWVKNKRADGDTFTRYTIGGFLSMSDRVFNVKIDQRYKG